MRKTWLNSYLESYLSQLIWSKKKKKIIKKQVLCEKLNHMNNNNP